MPHCWTHPFLYTCSTLLHHPIPANRDATTESSSARPAAPPRLATRGDGHGLPQGLRYPDLTTAAQRYLDESRSDATIHAQIDEAAMQRIGATPTLRLQDNESGKTLLLHGPVGGDALLSAIDLLTAGGSEPTSANETPVDEIGGIPR